MSAAFDSYRAAFNALFVADRDYSVQAIIEALLPDHGAPSPQQVAARCYLSYGQYPDVIGITDLEIEDDDGDIDISLPESAKALLRRKLARWPSDERATYIAHLEADLSAMFHHHMYAI